MVPRTFDLYVDSLNGSDANTGASPGAAFATIAHANSVATAGQKIGLARGSTFKENVTVPQNNLTYAPYGDLAKAAPWIRGGIDASAATWSISSGSIYQATVAGLSDTNATFAWVDGTTVLTRAASLVAMAAGTFFTNAASNLLYVWLADSSSPSGRAIDVTNTPISTTGWKDQKAGTNVFGVKISIWSNFAVIVQPPALSSGTVYCWNEIGPTGTDGINLSNTTEAVLRWNYIHDCWDGLTYPTSASHGITVSSADDTEIAFNAVTNCTDGIRMFGSAWHYANIHHNLVYKIRVDCIDVQGGVVGYPATVANNTVYHSPDPAGQAGHGIDSQSANVGPIWRNNIVYSDYSGTNSNIQLYCLSPAPASLPGTDVDYNLGFIAPGSTCSYGKINTTSYATFSAWQSALASSGFTGNEAHGINADPQFKSLSTLDFSLLSSSPALSAGTPVAETPVGAATPDLGYLLSEFPLGGLKASSISVSSTSVAPDWEPSDHGYLGWTFDPLLVNSSVSSITGRLVLTRVNLRSAQSISNVLLYYDTAGTTLTAGQCLAGVYNSSGVLVAQTADQSTAWSTAGNFGLINAIPLTGAPFSVGPGFIWVATLAVGTTTPLFGKFNAKASSLPNGTSAGASPGLSLANSRMALHTTTGLTALPASFTPSSQLAQGFTAGQVWAAVS